MSNKWKAIVIISLTFNIAVVCALVYGTVYHARFNGERPYRDYGMPGRSRGMHLGRRMGLPPDKMLEVGRIFDELRDESAELQEKLGTARGELVDLIHAEEPDETAVMEKTEEISAIQGELEKLLVRRLLRVNDILDPEERERFLQLLKRKMHPGFRRHMRESGRHPGRAGGR
jgi:Spy/CpxP family protein refolding chaperone